MCKSSDSGATQIQVEGVKIEMHWTLEDICVGAMGWRIFRGERKVLQEFFRDHAMELGNPMPDKPMLFLKPTTSYVLEGSPIKFPKGCKVLHHEVELGVVIGRNGLNVPEDRAMEYVGGYALALDMTARDLQDDAKKKGHPWTLAKGFDTSCPIGSFLSKELVADPHDLNLWLKVNDNLKQSGSTRDMHFTIPMLISYASAYFTLEPGDLILTGTPAGVGPVCSGDVIEAGIDGITKFTFRVA